MHPNRRVLIALTYYKPHISGLSEYARMQAEGLAKRGWSVTVLVYRHKDDLPRDEMMAGVRVVRVDPLIRLHKGMVGIGYLLKLRSLAVANDIVHLHVPMLEAGALTLMAPAGVRLVTTYHCDVTSSRDRSFLDWAAVQAVLLSARICLKRSHQIIGTSLDYLKGSMIAAPHLAKCRAIPPPDQAPDSLEPRIENLSKLRVGFLGRFVEEKGIDVLLHAAKLVLERNPNVEFVLAGDFTQVPGGSQFETLRNRLESLGSKVQLPGKIADENLFDFYRSLNVFVLPSVNSYEAFGMVQVEAMKAGVPVVASNRRGMRVPIQETGNGILFPAGDAAALAEAILNILATPPAPPHEIASKAWSKYRNNAFLDQIEAAYFEVLNESGRFSKIS